MPKNQFLTRLDNLLSGLGQEKQNPIVIHSRSDLGWSWRCDADRHITFCSPEVKYLLGISPDDFIGQQIDSHHLTPESAISVRNALRNGNSNKEIKVRYLTIGGDILPAIITINPAIGPADTSQNSGWDGHVRVLVNDPTINNNNHEHAIFEPDTSPISLEQSLLSKAKGNPPGYLAERDEIFPAERILTEIGKESIQYKRLLFSHAEEDRPATIAVPAQLHDDSTNLVLEFIDSTTPRQWSEDELALVEQVADQLTLAIENAQLFKQTQIQADELNLLRKISLELAREQYDLQSVIEIIIRRAVELLDSESGAIWLWNEADQKFDLQSAYSSGTFSNPPENISIKDELHQVAFKKRKTQVVNNYLLWGASPNTGGNGAPAPAMAVPLIWQTREIGVLLVARSNQQPTYTPNERHLIELLAAQAAAVIQNAALFDQTQKALQETDLLYKASAELNASTTYSEILNVLMNYTILGDQSSEVTINLYDQPWSGMDTPEWYDQIARWPSENDNKQLNLRYAINTLPHAQKLLSAGSLTIIQDAARDHRLSSAARDYFTLQRKARGVIFTPLVTTGQWIGHISALYLQPIHFPETAIRRLTTLAGQAAIAVQNLRLLDETRRRADELQTAAEIARDTTGTLSLDVLLGRTAELIRERFHYYHTEIFLMDEGGRFAYPTGSGGDFSKDILQRTRKISVGSNSVIGYVTQVGEPLLVNDVIQDPLHLANPLLPDTQAEVGIPLKIGDRVIGALDVQSDRINAFTPNDISVLQILADQIAVAVENARSYEISLEAMEEMRKADQLKSQFLANMSHELRTPLNSIIGFSRVILKGIDGPVNDTQEQDLQAIYGAGQHLLSLINDILDLSKIEAGKMELSLVDQVQVDDLVHSILSTATGLVKDKPIEIICEITPKLPAVRADPLKIRQVLLNLISNAAKFTDQGSITIKAEELSADSDSQYVKVSVTDTGQGISIEDQKKLFLPFSQVDASPTRKTGGSGLGLSICRHLIEMHQGQIGVQSDVGKGSTFYFTIPASASYYLDEG